MDGVFYIHNMNALKRSIFLLFVIASGCENSEETRLELSLDHPEIQLGSSLLLTVRNIGERDVLLPTCGGRISIPVEVFDEEEWKAWGGINIYCVALYDNAPFLLETDAQLQFNYSPGVSGRFRFVIVNAENRRIATREFTVLPAKTFPGQLLE
jgi:hypothetical protein